MVKLVVITLDTEARFKLKVMAYSRGFEVVCVKLGHKLKFSLPFSLNLLIRDMGSTLWVSS